MRALEYRAKELDLELPVLEPLLRSNQLQIQQAFDQIVETGKKRVGLLGFSFKAGTDDLRESPMVILAETLLGKGYAVRIYDRNVLIARLTGSNKDYIEQQIPHLSKLLCETIDEVIDELRRGGDWQRRTGIRRSRHSLPSRADGPRPRSRAVRSRRGSSADYQGICW